MEIVNGLNYEYPSISEKIWNKKEMLKKWCQSIFENLTLKNYAVPAKIKVNLTVFNFWVDYMYPDLKPAVWRINQILIQIKGWIVTFNFTGCCTNFSCFLRQFFLCMYTDLLSWMYFITVVIIMWPKKCDF